MADRHVPGIHGSRDRVRDGGGRPVNVHPVDSGRLDRIWSGDLKDQGYTDDDLTITARVLSRVCPMCGAGVDVWCRTASENVLASLDLQHVARRSCVLST
ncbi:hypothetical protein [Actinopolymorpha sp. B9G3]|uniref:zinc finger domain-containing protein n=1 Tax=Actinopolymorpha sp. B9G3 TaxID=3158970 RepID=UPI0032D915ED